MMWIIIDDVIGPKIETREIEMTTMTATEEIDDGYDRTEMRDIGKITGQREM